MADLVFRIQEPGRPSREVDAVDGMTIGRDPGATCVFEDQNVSGHHARVISKDGQLHIEDTGSSNKTRISNGPILGKGQSQALEGGMRFFVGKSIVDVLPARRGKPVAATENVNVQSDLGGEEPKTVVTPPKTPKPAAKKPAPPENVEETVKKIKKVPAAAKPAPAKPVPDAKTTTPDKPAPVEAKPAPAPAKPAPAAAKPAPAPAKPAPAAAKPAPAPAKPAPAKPAPAKPAPAKPAPAAAKPAPAKPAKPTPAAAKKPAPKKAAVFKVELPDTPKGTKSPKSFSLNRYYVDLSTYHVKRVRVQCADFEDVLGGAARAYKILEDYDVDHAYDAGAPLIMNLGLLSGSQFMTGLRTYFHGYSPLKASLGNKPSAMWSAGSGKLGTKLRYLGVDEVVFTGRAVVPVYLQITPGADGQGPQFRFKNAEHLSGRMANDKIQQLYTEHPDAHFAVIGPAGENYENVNFAAIALSTMNQLRSGDMKSRFCGRGGMGGIMGSKNLLAVVADTKDLDRGGKVAGIKEINQIVARGPGSQRFRDARKGDGGGGTWANMTALNPLHAMPEYNFNPTGTEISIPLYRESVEEEGTFLVKDEACFACGIACHKNVYEKNEDGKKGAFRAKFDYEPLNLMSANIGIFDIDKATHLVDMVDDLCMDSISCGVTLSYAMEYNRRMKEQGKKSLLPDYVEYGNYEGAKRAIEEIGRGELPLLGQGSKRLSEALGEIGFAMHCKGMEFAAYLPQHNPGYPWALAGAHMSMRTYLLYVFDRDTKIDYWVNAITETGPTIMRDDLVGVCKFSAMSNEHMVYAIAGLSGLKITEEEVAETVMRTYLRGYKLEKKQGFTRADYVMPADVHKAHDKIDLPDFNTPEFFQELSERVCDRFDQMLLSSGV